MVFYLYLIHADEREMTDLPQSMLGLSVQKYN